MFLMKSKRSGINRACVLIFLVELFSFAKVGKSRIKLNSKNKNLKEYPLKIKLFFNQLFIKLF